MRKQQTNAAETLDLSDGALKKIFESVAAGRLSPDDALARYREKKAETIGEFAVLDTDIALRGSARVRMYELMIFINYVLRLLR